MRAISSKSGVPIWRRVPAFCCHEVSTYFLSLLCEKWHLLCCFSVKEGIKQAEGKRWMLKMKWISGTAVCSSKVCLPYHMVFDQSQNRRILYMRQPAKDILADGYLLNVYSWKCTIKNIRSALSEILFFSDFKLFAGIYVYAWEQWFPITTFILCTDVITIYCFLGVKISKSLVDKGDPLWHDRLSK